MSRATRVKRFFGYDASAPIPGFEDVPAFLPPSEPVTAPARRVRKLDCGHVAGCFATGRNGQTSCLDCYRTEMSKL